MTFTLRSLTPSQSHVIGVGAEYRRMLFRLNGQSPLVSRYMELLSFRLNDRGGLVTRTQVKHETLACARALSGSTRGQLGGNSGVNSGATRGQLGVNSGATRGQLGGNSGATRGQLGGNSGATRGVNSGSTRGQLGGNSGATRETHVTRE